MQLTRFPLGALCVFASLAMTAHAQQALPDDVIAQQGGAMVTMQDIDAYAQRIPENDRPGFFDSPKRIESVIMSLLLQKQLAGEARAAKLDQDPGVQAQIRLATDDTLARAANEQYRKGLKFPDFAQLANEYYLSHKAEFAVRGAVDVKHVLVSSKERDDAAAKARINEVEAAARAHPEQFDALVEKYSDDPSKADNHGLIADAASGKTVGQFSDAAKALKKPGEISPVVKTEFGYHVLKLIERKPDTQRTFAEVKDGLMEKLRNDFIEREGKDHTNKLRGNKLDANPDLVASIRTRFLPAGAKLPSEIAEEANEEARRKKAEQDAKDKQAAEKARQQP